MNVADHLWDIGQEKVLVAKVRIIAYLSTIIKKKKECNCGTCRLQAPH